jgi:intracellular septation protein A
LDLTLEVLFFGFLIGISSGMGDKSELISNMSSFIVLGTSGVAGLSQMARIFLAALSAAILLVGNSAEAEGWISAEVDGPTGLAFCFRLFYHMDVVSLTHFSSCWNYFR